jgi:predicted amidohydrolase
MRGASSGEFAATLVQSGFTTPDYESPEAFKAKVRSLCDEIPPSRSARQLVVFPELTGLWIPLLDGRRPASLPALAASLFLRHPLGLLGALATGRGISPLIHLDWQASLRAWVEPFRDAARRLGAYLCPGSALLPLFDWESRQGPHLTGRGMYNTSCLISPRGTILGWTRKIHPPPAERRLGVRPGCLHDLGVYHTDIGRIGLLLSLDGFHETAVQQLDRLGCQVLLQPSASSLPWGSPPRHPPQRGIKRSQEDLWLGEGLGYLIRGRENIALALNPMSVSSVLGCRHQGRSTVFLNPAKGAELRSPRKLPEGHRSYSGLAAITASCDGEEILTVAIAGLP